MPLPEAVDYQVQVREKADEKRLARRSKADFTRFDLHVGGQIYRDQWKRGMVLRVVRTIVASGIAPEKLTDLLPRGASRFVSVDGRCYSDEFLTKAQKPRAPWGERYDLGRYFVSRGDLIEFDGRTYAFSHQWGGKRFFKTLRALAECYPDLAIRWNPSGEEVEADS